MLEGLFTKFNSATGVATCPKATENRRNVQMEGVRYDEGSQ